MRGRSICFGILCAIFGAVFAVGGCLVCAAPEIAIPAIDGEAEKVMAEHRARRPPRRRVMSVATNDGWRVVHFDDLTSRSNRVVEVRLEPPPKIKYGYPQGRKK